MPGLTDMPALSVVEADEDGDAPDDAAWAVVPDPAAVLEAPPLEDLEELPDEPPVELALPDEAAPEELAEELEEEPEEEDPEEEEDEEEEAEELLLLVVLLLLPLLLEDSSPEVVSPMSFEEVVLEALMLCHDPEVPS